MAEHTSGSGEAARRWLTAYGHYRDFVEQKGELPKETITPGSGTTESRLAFWGRYQRRRFARDAMPEWQRELLEAVPRFAWEPSGERWSARCSQLAVFLSEQGRVPKYRSEGTSERQLAAWVHKQRHLHQQGKLEPERVAALRCLPFRIL